MNITKEDLEKWFERVFDYEESKEYFSFKTDEDSDDFYEDFYDAHLKLYGDFNTSCDAEWRVLTAGEFCETEEEFKEWMDIQKLDEIKLEGENL